LLAHGQALAVAAGQDAPGRRRQPGGAASANRGEGEELKRRW